MGHEYAGTVAVSEAVDAVSVGDRVIEKLIPHWGDCFQYRNG